MSAETFKFRKYISILMLWILALPAFAVDMSSPSHTREILSFSTMYAVGGAFLTPEHQTDPNIRGVVGDYQAWKIGRFIRGKLLSDGQLFVTVRGLVFPNAANDETHFRALVSCLTESNQEITTQNIITDPFPTGPAGNANIHAHLQLPSPCVAPIVMILNGNATDGNVWFAVSGL